MIYQTFAISHFPTHDLGVMMNLSSLEFVEFQDKLLDMHKIKKIMMNLFGIIDMFFILRYCQILEEYLLAMDV